MNTKKNIPLTLVIIIIMLSVVLQARVYADAISNPVNGTVTIELDGKDSGDAAGASSSPSGAPVEAPVPSASSSVEILTPQAVGAPADAQPAAEAATGEVAASQEVPAVTGEVNAVQEAPVPTGEVSVPSEAPVPTGEINAVPVSAPAAVGTEAVNPADQPQAEAAAQHSSETVLVRPVAVMIENEPPARPQSGLYAAKVLFEIQAEEVTRFMAVYYDYSQSFEIGPIRSARHYFVDISTMFDAAYVHVGGSPMGLAEIKDRNINNINAIKGDRGFYRTSDRRIPHNLYAKLPNLKKEMERKKYRTETAKPVPFDFSESKLTSAQMLEKGVAGSAVKVLHIPYSRGYRVSYEFNPAENNFTRFYNNRPFKDYRNSTVVKSDNVVIMRCKMHMIDAQMRHEMDLYEGGTCEIFVGGHHTSGTWDRDRTSGVFKYYDAGLNDVKFNPGNIILHVVSPNQPVIVDDQTFVSEKKKSVKKSKKGKNSKKSAQEDEGEGEDYGQ
ncbi:MAG TPA: hypothetical protein DC017_06475 [Candidatus Wallbacteria bacterium]|nr:hypothetical protein [Candidatus Wallbacteria bacterium]